MYVLPVMAHRTMRTKSSSTFNIGVVNLQAEGQPVENADSLHLDSLRLLCQQCLNLDMKQASVQLVEKNL